MPSHTPLDQFIEQQLKAGKYQSYEAMVQAGLRLLQEQEDELDAIADELRPAMEDFLQGERGEEVDIEAIKAEGRKHLMLPSV